MSQEKGRFGSWILATGATLAAIANTKGIDFDEETRSRLDLYGNVLAASGNALISDSIDELDAEKIGLKILATGNLTVVYGNIASVDDEAGIQFGVKGNLIQALGGSFALTEVFNPGGPKAEVILTYGVILITIGSGMEAIGGILELGGDEKQRLVEVGAWTKSLGTILVMLSFFLDEDT